MPIRTPVVIEIDRKTWLIQEYGLACCYALLGSESGLLIDTGCGRMNIRRLAERLFEGRPYDVVLTHGHGRHTGGVGQFPAVGCAEALGAPVLHDALSPDFLPPEFEAESMQTEVYPLYTGDTFDLGGREVVCIATPGHTMGSCSFFDKQSGIAFVGDACGTHLKIGTSVADALTGLMRLKRLTPGLTRLYGGHVSHMDYRGMKPQLLEDAICACRAALAPDGRQYYLDEQTVQLRSVTLHFCKDRFWSELEPHSPYPLGL